MQLLINFILGALIGFIVSIVGLGGGTLFVPTLLFLYGFDIHTAVSTSILATVFTTTSAFLYYRKKVKIKYRLGTILELVTIPGAVLGSYFTNMMDRRIIEFLFALILLLSSIKFIHEYLYSKQKVRVDKPFREIKWTKILLGLLGSFLAGFISGSVGLSGGSIKVPVLILLVGIPERIAVATSTFMMILTTLAALITHNIYGKVNYEVGVLMGLGAFIGAQFGGRVNLRLDQKMLKFVLGVFLLLISLRVFMDVF